MALTTSVVRRSVIGSHEMIVLDVTFDSSYATGGESLDPASVQLINLAVVIPSSVGGNLIQYDYTNKKLKAVVSSTGVEVANATDLSAVTSRVVLIGQ